MRTEAQPSFQEVSGDKILSITRCSMLVVRGHTKLFTTVKEVHTPNPGLSKTTGFRIPAPSVGEGRGR